MKAVLMSIQPNWCELIASGKKTIEVRKTLPKIETPFKCYIYCTKKSMPNGDTLLVDKTDGKISVITRQWVHNRNILRTDGSYYMSDRKPAHGKIIGEFLCDNVSKGDNEFYAAMIEAWNGEDYDKYGTYLTYHELNDYCNGKDPYLLSICNLKIYDKPKELSEFSHFCKMYNTPLLCKYPVPCDNAYIGTCHNGYLSLSRPPQSWCFVEELE